MTVVLRDIEPVEFRTREDEQVRQGDGLARRSPTIRTLNRLGEDGTGALIRTVHRVGYVDSLASTMASSSGESAMVTWDIQRYGRAWGGEAMSRYEMTPEKTEMLAGKLYGTEEERLTMLALLLENVGTDKAVRLGNPDTWRAAVDGRTTVAAVLKADGTLRPSSGPPHHHSPPCAEAAGLPR